MTGTEPRSFARAAGAVYLGYFAAAIFGSLPVSRRMNPAVAVACLADVLYAITSLLF